MTTNFYLIHIHGDGRGGDDPRLLGPFETQHQQVNTARVIRDRELEPDDRLFWMDIASGVPRIKAFDPQFYTHSEDYDA